MSDFFDRMRQSAQGRGEPEPQAETSEPVRLPGLPGWLAGRKPVESTRKQPPGPQLVWVNPKKG